MADKFNSDGVSTVEPLVDPESLRDRKGVKFIKKTEIIDQEEFEVVPDLENWDSHVVVGVTNDEGEVLLMNDGSHGWTLTAFPVKPGEDWIAVGRCGVENLVDGTVKIDGPKRVRRVDCRLEGEDVCQTSLYNVVLGASLTDETGVDEYNDGDDDGTPETGWFDEVPEDVTGDLEDDILLFLY